MHPITFTSGHLPDNFIWWHFRTVGWLGYVKVALLVKHVNVVLPQSSCWCSSITNWGLMNRGHKKNFRDDMMSKDTSSLERSNMRISSVIHQSSSLMAKSSSLTDISPSHPSSPFSLKSCTDTTKPRTGKFLRPRSTQDALSKFDSLYIIYI